MFPFVYRLFYGFLSFLFLNVALAANPLKIGVIVPAQHPAMTAIVEGFKASLSNANVTLTIKNAQGDAMLQQQIIQHMVAQQMDILVPIGTATSLMTLALAPQTPILAVAASFETHPDLKNAKRPLMVINDEVSVAPVLDLVTQHMPKAQHIGILYSNCEKNLPDIEQAKALCSQHNLKLHLRKADTIQEVLQYAPTLAKQVDVLFVLKDHLVVSAIQTVIASASQAKCLLIVMDDGSVRQGAPLGLGILEADIGRIAGQVLSQSLTQGFPKAFQEIPLRALHLFINSETFHQQTHLRLEALQTFSKSRGFILDKLSTSKGQKQ